MLMIVQCVVFMLLVMYQKQNKKSNLQSHELSFFLFALWPGAARQGDRFSFGVISDEYSRFLNFQRSSPPARLAGLGTTSRHHKKRNTIALHSSTIAWHLMDQKPTNNTI